MKKHNTLICIPTFNEAQNADKIYREIKKIGVKADLLFIDDNSPDGTGQIIDKLAKNDDTVFTIHRAGKQGIGSAHLAGISWAYDKKYDVLITMDCDFSHSPHKLPDFIASINDHDVVVGSRYRKKGSLKSWSMIRKTMTHTGHFLTNIFLKMPYDATGAYRIYKIINIPRGTFHLVRSRGYAFFFESLYILHLNGHSIKEIPISLPSRTYGHSKMRIRDAKDSLTRLIKVCIRKYFDKTSFIYNEPFMPDRQMKNSKERDDWDAYWLANKKPGGALYDLIAVFYRKVIIRGLLNHFVKKHFQRGAKVLHAGCGSGQVDVDISDYLNITALDISAPALDRYKRINGKSAKVMHASIFEIPVDNGTFEGIYNLGVMEHFTEEEILRILSEFRRVLRPNGKVMLFWPPEFGISVIFLKMVHFVLNRMLRKNITLHPAEISRIKSKKQVRDICSKAGFKMVDYYFGPRDLFTYCVVVLVDDRVAGKEAVC